MRALVSALAAMLAITTHAHAQRRGVGADSVPPTITMPAGTVLSARLAHALSTRAAHPGDTVELQLSRPALLGDTVIVPAGAHIEGLLDGITRRGSVHPRGWQPCRP